VSSRRLAWGFKFRTALGCAGYCFYLRASRNADRALAFAAPGRRAVDRRDRRHAQRAMETDLKTTGALDAGKGANPKDRVSGCFHLAARGR